MTGHTTYLFIILTALLMTACHSTGAQRPSQRTRQPVAVDSLMLQQIETNRHMVEEADRALTHLAAKGYALTDEHYWIKGLPIDEREAWEDREVSIRLKVRKMNGTLLEDRQTTVKVGKSSLLPAVDNILLHARSADTVSMGVPWYQAYGAAGNGRVEPYENVMIELIIE